jgi:rhodanese-related sulfurtransferase
MLLLAFGVGLPSLVYAQKPTAYMDITVDKAHNIIEHEPFSHIVILDVRNQSEYDLGHLYNAVLIPVYQLENRTRELQAHANDEIIVYCRAGSRSALACQILVENGFTKVYNMLGGIIAWINAGYSIYTTFHYVTVDTTDRTQIQIDPMLLHSCGCSSCSQSASTCPCNKEIGDGEYSILEQNESRIVFLQQFEVNGTTFIVTVDRSLLWSYATHENDINRTAGFFLTVTTDGNMSMRFYTLIYAVQNAEYDLTITTNILLLNSEKYDNSFTIIKYVPAGKPEVESRESVHFNSSVTLSQQYAILGEIARKIGKAYRKSENAALSSLASS